MSDHPRSLPRAPNPEPSVPQLTTSTLRQRLKDATYAATGKTPHPWQLDIAEALCNRRDVLCIAGTGKGKTLAFVMPYFVDPRTLIWVVSPLNYIQKQQERTFRDEWNIPACAVNATTSYAGLHKDILNGEYRVIITSPERLLEHNKLRPIIIQLGAQNWNNIVIVDECHCICIWSDQFRKMYGILGTLRIFLLPGTPFCAATATATKSMQSQIRTSLRYTDDYLFVNEGYWKPNLSWHVHYMQGSDSSIGEITYAFPKSLTSTSSLPPTIIFVDERGLAFDILKTLQEFLPPELASKVEIYHALQSQLAKDLIAERFARGEILILICTEALTMGCDFRHIEQVIMFKVPKTLPTVLQRGGRGGRNEKIWCRVILMVEASKHKLATVKPTGTAARPIQIKTEDEHLLWEGAGQETDRVIGVDEVAAGEVGSDGPEVDEQDEQTRDAIRVASLEHGKQDDAYLKLFYEPTDRCRTSVLDEAFCSPEHAPCISVNGCDNCIRHRIKELEAGTSKAQHQELGLVKQEPVEDDSAILSDAQETPDAVLELRKLLIEPRPKKPLPKPKERATYRPMDERGVLEELLMIWRRSIYQSDCKGLGINADHIITDQTIAAIARVLPPVTKYSLSKITPKWPKKPRNRWGSLLLDIVRDFDLPANANERKVERARLRKEAQTLRVTHGVDTVKSEGSLPRKKAAKRKVESTGLASSSTAKRQRTQSDIKINAESATETGPWAPSQVEEGSTAPHSNTRSPGTPTRNSENNPRLLYSTTPKTPTSSNPTQVSPLVRTPASQSPHYRPQAYRPNNSSPLLPRLSPHSRQGPEQINQPGSQAARAVGTILIRRTTNSTSVPSSSAPVLSSAPVSPSSPAPATQTPKPRSRYYRDHLYELK